NVLYYKSSKSCTPPPPSAESTADVMLTAASWFHTPWRRILLFLLCSPLLLLLLCLSIPLLCAVEIFSLIVSRFVKPPPSSSAVEEVIAVDEDALLRCEEGFGVEVEVENGESGLLHRYLDDQLSLARSICEDDDGDHERDLIRVPLLS
ncbi:PREDICTED: uncharacterized protein LOC104738305, partial [Camelina sativa]|uniref:Uncharacterized protein LOC104738305 n=1 Tax=Camelina sativa TaxID=90675 RepID=A0ABM0VIP9_CAMSA